jgi:hypothetical protein
VPCVADSSLLAGKVGGIIDEKTARAFLTIVRAGHSVSEIWDTSTVDKIDNGRFRKRRHVRKCSPRGGTLRNAWRSAAPCDAAACSGAFGFGGFLVWIGACCVGTGHHFGGPIPMFNT